MAGKTTYIRVRLNREQRDAIETEAVAAGVTAADFLRGAGMARAAFTYARRGGEGCDALEALYDQAQAFALRWPPGG